MNDENRFAQILKPDLFEFEDYRAYLNAVILQESSLSGGISMARFAEAFGVSRSALSMLLNGQRDLTVANIHRIATVLRLDQNDHEYFEALVLKCQAQDEGERHYYEIKLQKKHQSVRCQTITTPSKTLISEWFIPAILIYLLDIDDDPEHLYRIAEGLSISKQHLDAVIESLRQEGYLSYKGKGNVHIAFNRVTHKISSQQYLKAVMHESQKRMDKSFYDEHSHFLAHCFSIPETAIAEFVSEYKALLQKYMASGDGKEETKRRIMQISTQFYAVL